MIRILSIFKNILLYREPKLLLGRWQIEKCNIKLNNKIKLSNEDNCGSSGEYAIIKNELNQKIIYINNDKNYIKV
jgi:hypothetical protein